MAWALHCCLVIHSGNASFQLGPDPAAIPLVFKYVKKNPEDMKFTTAASVFDNKELISTATLRMVWRVNYSADVQVGLQEN